MVERCILVNLFWESYDGSLSPLSLDLNVNAHVVWDFNTEKILTNTPHK